MSTQIEELAVMRGAYLDAIVLVLDGSAFAREERLGAVEAIMKQYRGSPFYDEETEDGR